MKLRKTLEHIVPYSPGTLKEGAIKLASNENPLGPSPKAIARIKEMATTVSLYPDAGVGKLRDAVAKKLGMERDNLIFGNGSDEVLCLITGAYIEEGDNTVTSEHTFSEYTFATVLFGGKVKYAPMKDGRFDLTKLLEVVDSRTKIVFLCNPNNPTGTSFGEKEFRAFMERLPSSILVVSDEAYREYVERPDFPDTLRMIPQYPNLVVLRTFSKIYGLAGLRVGYGVGSKEVIADFYKTKTPFNVNLLAQEAALAALEDEEFVKLSVETNRKGKSYLYQEFDRLGLKYYPTDANFVCVHVGRDSVEVFRTIMELGVTIRPLRSFQLNEWIRVTIGTEDQNRKFVKCLEQALRT
ncbi:MAG: histidinol-phosphate transaminase [Spirochaetes bacterium]|nr:histidinol-phosphate transaminase [Spirochaetota bacterium]